MKIRIGFLGVTALALIAACGQSEAPQTVQSDIEGLGIPSGTYAVDRGHTFVAFSYLHQGLSYPLIRAIGVDGELELDASSLENSVANIAVEVNSIRTNLDYFDEELASRKFFHADKFPYATLTTHRYVALNESIGKLEGFLTIRDITRPVVMDVTLNGAMQHPMMNKPVIGFSATGVFQRSDYGLDRFVPMVADEIIINVEAEFMQGSNDGSASAVATALAASADADSSAFDVEDQPGADR